MRSPLLTRRDYYLLFSIYLCSVMFLNLRSGLGNVHWHDSWAIGDWLINYSGGFVRRGLPGELILRTASALHLSAAYEILALQFSLYCITFYVVWKLLENSKWSLWMIFLLLSPATFGFTVLDPYGGFRKEIIYFAVLSILLLPLADPRKNPPKAGWITTYLSLACVAMVLSHESLICYFPFLLGAVAIGFKSWGRAIGICLVPAFLSLLAFYVVVKHPGNLIVAGQICSSVGYKLNQPGSGLCSGAISALADTPQIANRKRLQWSATDNNLVFYPIVGLFALLPVIAGVWALFRDSASRYNAKILLIVTFISIAASSVLFFYAVDWGRWIYIHIFSILLLLLLIDHRRNAISGPSQPASSRRASRSAVVTAFCLLFLYTVSWNIRCSSSRPRLGYIRFALMPFKQKFPKGWLEP
jgi:hypothetical protein